ncbi:15744_t:CDS:2, partial [Racocetra fulgida]
QPEEQSIMQLSKSENESHQPKPFEFDCLIDVKKFCETPRELIAVSNNKLIAIQSHTGIIDDHLWVQEVSKKQWIKYLREELNVYNEIRVLPKKSQIEEVLKKFIDNSSISEMNETQSCKGSLVKWEVYGNKRIIKAFLKKSDLESVEYNLKLNNRIYYTGGSLDLYIYTYKVQNNNWDDTIEIPFLPKMLLKIVNLYKDKNELSQKFENITKEIIQKLTNDEKKEIQKLDNEKIIHELKKNLLKEIDRLEN